MSKTLYQCVGGIADGKSVEMDDRVEVEQTSGDAIN